MGPKLDARYLAAVAEDEKRDSAGTGLAIPTDEDGAFEVA
jgi:hypothetical protein